jgi:hypothetical protein
MKKTIVTLICVIQASITFSQTTKYELSAEGNALMCPFMGPRLKKQLEANGAYQIEKDKSHVFHFTMEANKAIGEIEIMEIVRNVGYDPKLFHLKMNEDE